MSLQIITKETVLYIGFWIDCQDEEPVPNFLERGRHGGLGKLGAGNPGGPLTFG